MKFLSKKHSLFLILAMVKYFPAYCQIAAVPNITEPISTFEYPIVDPYQFVEHPGNSGIAFAGLSGISGNYSLFTMFNPPAPEGEQVLYLQSTGSIIIERETPVDGFYRIRYKAARRNTNPDSKQNIRSFIDDQLVSDKPIENIGYCEIKSTTLYLKGGVHKIELSGTAVDDQTAFVDDLKFERIWDWNEPITWGGDMIPSHDHEVKINPEVAVAIYNLTPTKGIDVKMITVNGELIVPQNKDLDLMANGIMIEGELSKLEIGQLNVPYEGNTIITLRDHKHDNPEHDDEHGIKHLVVSDYGTLDLHGLPKTSWTKFKNVIKNTNTEPDSPTEIEVDDLKNWKVGDQIVITPYNNNVGYRNDMTENDDLGTIIETTIKEINAGSNQITVDKYVSPDHIGSQQTYSNGTQTWKADLRPEVGMLSHNIKIQGDEESEETKMGGHIMIMDNGMAYVENIELYRMGQKQILKRYPFHWHILGDAGYKQYFLNSSIHHSFNRAIVVHKTNKTLIDHNFFYDHVGHGVFLESGSETGNWISNNLVLRTIRPKMGNQLLASDNGGTNSAFNKMAPGELDMVQNRTPASFWITNPMNVIENNIAAGTEGTGYWFAFPEMAQDHDGKFVFPNTLPLLSFKGNTAHSCMNGIDFFDGLTSKDEIISNKRWAYKELVNFENCLWYANHTAVYCGTNDNAPAYNFMFNNNIFVENYADVMLASYVLINRSVFVADEKLKLMDVDVYEKRNEYMIEPIYYSTPPVSSDPQVPPPPVKKFRTTAYRIYDGAGRIENSHFIGWQDEYSNLLWNSGAALKHTNHLFNNITTEPTIPIIPGTDHPIRIELEDFTHVKLPHPPFILPLESLLQPQMWNVVVKDVDGSLTGRKGSSIVSNHPFVHFEEDAQFNNWNRAYRSDYSFVTAIVRYPSDDKPVVVITRTKTGTKTASMHDLLYPAERGTQIAPVIVNSDFLYTYRFNSLPVDKRLQLMIDDAKPGDVFYSSFKGFANFEGIDVGDAVQKSNFEEFLQSSQSCYYKFAGDLFIKIVATGKVTSVDVAWWSGGYSPYDYSIYDTDGDEMLDMIELAGTRDPFTAADLAAHFATDNLNEGWDVFNDIPAHVVANGSLVGISDGTDAQIINNNYNFEPGQVKAIEVTLKAFTTSPINVDLFFKTDLVPFYNENMKVRTTYSGAGAAQSLIFNFCGNYWWRTANKITGLRLDPAESANTWFEIDLIKAVDPGISCRPVAVSAITPALPDTIKNTISLQENNSVKVIQAENFSFYPNPVKNTLTISSKASIINSIEIFSVSGQKLISKKINSLYSVVDLTILSKGIYFVKVFSNGQSKTVKIVKE